MHKKLKALQESLEKSFASQEAATASWHEKEPGEKPEPEECGTDDLNGRVLAQHLPNFLLWHVEDEARRTDVSDGVIADCKRRVDRLNQIRNDRMETLDRFLHARLAPLLPKDAAPRCNTESLAMAVDRLSILALKIYHMHEQTLRGDVGPEHIAACSVKLCTLRLQRESLARSVLELTDDYADGKKIPAPYSQFKMYNDPTLNPALYGRRNLKNPFR